MPCAESFEQELEYLSVNGSSTSGANARQGHRILYDVQPLSLSAVLLPDRQLWLLMLRSGLVSVGRSSWLAGWLSVYHFCLVACTASQLG